MRKMPTSFRKKLFLFVFCLASITQGMYSTYFVSILTIIERIYQIQSKTAGAIISATEIGQILGSLFIAYYGGRGNKPKWMAVCMTLSAIAALISISPHFILLATNNANLNVNRQQVTTDNINSSMISITPSPYLTSDLSIEAKLHENGLAATRLRDNLPNLNQLCRSENHTQTTASLNATHDTNNGKINFAKAKLDDASHEQSFPISIVIAIFSVCLLVIGFGSTAITTLGIPFIDDIISKEESPLYLGLTIGLRIFGPALGFILGSFCISLDSNSVLSTGQILTGQSSLTDTTKVELGAWWLGLIFISIPLLILAIPMYFLSKNITTNGSEKDDYEDITYQAAEDHDIGGSNDFPAHIMGLAGDLDITSNQTCFSSEIDSSSREVLQICQSSMDQYSRINNYKQNIAFEQPILSGDSMTKGKSRPSSANIEDNDDDNDEATSSRNTIDQWRAPNVCLVVNYLGALESTSLTKDDPPPNNQSHLPQITTRSSTASSISYADGDRKLRKKQQQTQDNTTISDLSSSLSRLIQNRLLVLRMLSGVLHILPIAGFYTFLPKYLIEQFRITSSSASVISGLAGILFVGFGAFIGGTIIRVFNVNSRMMTRWIAASALLYSIGMIILMNLSCDQNRLVHFNSPEYVSTDCSISCNCAQDNYNPVCANGTTYVTPCLAGCKGYKMTEGKIIYDECGCSSLATNNVTSEPDLIAASSHVNLNVAIQGQCYTSCDSIVWYVIIFSIFTLIHSSCEVGSMMFNLRCVKSDDRTLALGLITFSSSLLGTIPCSIIYGSIVDFTCVHWDRYSITSDSTTNSNHHGACRAYDSDSFRYYLHGLTAMVMSLAFVIDCIISTRSSEVDFYDCGNDSKMDIRVGLKKSTETIQ
uniref:Solute carrier organic anion transporter family member n=1 Tax=Aceria tosichella TaxID=561515 RepID=A0A6G1SGZ5_9ACAR